MSEQAGRVEHHGLKLVAAQLREQREDIRSTAVRDIRGELPSYRSVTEGELAESLDLNLDRGIATLLDGSVPRERDAENRRTARQRMDSEVPIEDIIRAYRISLTVTYEAYRDLAVRQGISAAEILNGAHLLWLLGDWFTAGVVREHRFDRDRRAVRTMLERADVVRRLLSRGPWPSRFATRLEAAGIRADTEYEVWLADSAASGFEHDMPATDPRSGGAVSARLEGKDVVLMPAADVEETSRSTAGSGCRVSRDIVAGGPWAAGPPRPLERLHESADVARQVLDVLPPEATGFHTAADAGWRLQLPLRELTHTTLEAMYLRPLAPHTPVGRDIVATVRTYLAHGFSVRATSQRLVVHQNTVRYRLERFERLTGHSLKDLDTVVGLALLLNS